MPVHFPEHSSLIGVWLELRRSIGTHLLVQFTSVKMLRASTHNVPWHDNCADLVGGSRMYCTRQLNVSILSQFLYYMVSSITSLRHLL